MLSKKKVKSGPLVCHKTFCNVIEYKLILYDRGITMERNHKMDVTKAIAVFLVVSIHTMPFSNFQFGFIDGHFFINTLARLAVPFFFASSGYLIGIKIKSNPNYIKKYLSNIFTTYTRWVLIFITFDVSLIVLSSYNDMAEIKSGLFNNYFGQFRISDIYYGFKHGTAFHLWFLIALYIAVVILLFFIKTNKVKMLLIFSFLLHVLGLFGQSYSVFFTLPFNTRDAIFFALFYVTLGFFLSNKVITIYKQKTIISLLFALALLQLIERMFLVYMLEAPWGNYFLSTIPLTICLMLFLIKYPIVTKTQRLIKIGQNTLGIYVIHPLIIVLLELTINIFDFENVTSTLMWNLLFTPLVFIISYFSYKLLQRLMKAFKCS
jgi:surface polysaccharide O-acyltransferase-like enzyme